VFVAQTERLIIRHFKSSDVTAMSGVFGDAKVMRYGEGVKSSQWVNNWITQCIEEVNPDLGVSPMDPGCAARIRSFRRPGSVA
jgi:hypothetical protein